MHQEKEKQMQIQRFKNRAVKVYWAVKNGRMKKSVALEEIERLIKHKHHLEENLEWYKLAIKKINDL